MYESFEIHEDSNAVETITVETAQPVETTVET